MLTYSVSEYLRLADALHLAWLFRSCSHDLFRDHGWQCWHAPRYISAAKGVYMSRQHL